ncbi:hypothetical protein THAOC_11244 [Thalassiosira oceanica]|uniref:Uncharacterized protein n=1 Tax=Thalassiosira oceanica TaxID=159749 RepID=K0TB78_THAOC|nr:hypothetical protein THAOC_11244 [Thalassiosira oceanica]|eukprot:EJK67692.1 hypothetical protein THAOC_11244 [Thalassiosira oceanica]
MNISRSVSEESRIAFRSQADIVSEKSRARTPTRNNRQSKDSDFPDYDGYQVQADTMASAESRVPATLSKPNWDTTATGPPGDVASGKNEDKRPSAASLRTKAALNRKKMQKLRSRQKRAHM